VVSRRQEINKDRRQDEMRSVCEGFENVFYNDINPTRWNGISKARKMTIRPRVTEANKRAHNTDICSNTLVVKFIARTADLHFSSRNAITPFILYFLMDGLYY